MNIQFLQLLNNYYFLIILSIWEVIWKGLSLWKAAGKKQKYWFIALLIINSIGILPILYIFYFSKSRSAKPNPGMTN